MALNSPNWSWPWKSLLFTTTCLPTYSVIQLYPLYLHFPLNGSCKNYFSSHFTSIQHSTTQEKPYVFPLLISTLPLCLNKSFGVFMKGYRTYYFQHIPIPLPSCISPVWDTAADHFCLYTFQRIILLTVPNLKPSYCVFFQYSCRKIKGSTFLQEMHIWLEGNSSNWPHPWPQLDM